MATKATSGKSNGAAGTVARKTIAQPTQQKQSASNSIAGTAKSGSLNKTKKVPGPVGGYAGRPTSGGSATNRISGTQKSEKNGTFQKASGKKPAVQVARANTPDRIANRMATIQSKKGGR